MTGGRPFRCARDGADVPHLRATCQMTNTQPKGGRADREPAGHCLQTSHLRLCGPLAICTSGANVIHIAFFPFFLFPYGDKTKSMMV
jgi:hypothetical protein